MDYRPVVSVGWGGVGGGGGGGGHVFLKAILVRYFSAMQFLSISN